MDITSSTIFWALVGGALPALAWLWFWLKEDARHPEPKRLIVVTFIGGMLAVPAALILEKAVDLRIEDTTTLFVIWAGIEELLKYSVAFIVAFRKKCIDQSKCLDETIDPIIYLITAALGFAAIENMLFLLDPLIQGEPIAGFITGNLRFVGATILHIVTSASIGVAMGLSFYKKHFIKKIYLVVGIFTAILLHALFNLFIIKNNGESLFFVFSAVWVAVLVLLAMFEYIKKVNK